MRKQSYLVALGSNRRHHRHGSPAHVLAAAIKALAEEQIEVLAVSSVHLTPALGPAGRDFANAVALVATPASPPELLSVLKRIERRFGRRAGRRWGARVLDLDIVLWSEGVWPARLGWRSSRGLAVPHREMARRGFVLHPALEIAPAWRQPVSGLSIRQMAARLNKPRSRD